MATFEIKNEGLRPQAFKVRGGIETVEPNQTRVLDLPAKPTKEVVAAYKERGVKFAPSDKEAENPVQRLSRTVRERSAAPVEPAKDPAETGGVVPQSSKSENGGVDRKDGDTTTTTKPTEQQTGPVA